MPSPKNTKDKMIPNPENLEEEIENPDYIEPSNESDDENDAELSPEDKLKFEALVEKQLKKMKENVAKAYEARDGALTKAAELEAEKETARIAKLKDDGKLEEAFEAEKAQLVAKLKVSDARLVALTRDNDVKDALASFEFRSINARKNAVRDITDELVQDDTGIWKHKSGVSIEQFAKAFIEHADNAFLLKPKTNRGGGLESVTPAVVDKKSSGFIGRPQAEVLQEIRDRRAAAR